MERVQELIEELVVEDYQMSRELFDVIHPTSGGYYRNDSFESILERNQHVLLEDSMTEEEREELIGAIKGELKRKFEQYEICKQILQRACAGFRPDDVMAENDLAALFTWGPMAEMSALEELLYKDSAKIKDIGGPEAYLRNQFMGKMSTELHNAYQYGIEKSTLFKTLLSVCADKEFQDWSWLLDMIRVGEVAILARAELLFSVDGGIILAGSGYSHPVLPDFDASYSSLSSSRSEQMSTSQIVRIWPGRRIVRTLSRFYLLPNSFSVSDRANEVVSLIDNSDVYQRLREFEQSENKPMAFLNEGTKEYRNISGTLKERYRKIIQESAKFGWAVDDDTSAVH